MTMRALLLTLQEVVYIRNVKACGGTVDGQNPAPG